MNRVDHPIAQSLVRPLQLQYGLQGKGYERWHPAKDSICPANAVAFPTEPAVMPQPCKKAQGRKQRCKVCDEHLRLGQRQVRWFQTAGEHLNRDEQEPQADKTDRDRQSDYADQKRAQLGLDQADREAQSLTALGARPAPEIPQVVPAGRAGLALP